MSEASLSRRLGAVRELAPGGPRQRRETPDSEAQVAARRSARRLEALGTALRSGIAFVVWTIAAFMALGGLGISLGPLLAGAGVVGLAIGFGAQSLIKDFLSGFFILIEDQFAVGDIVDLAEGSGIASGVVEHVGLRSTRVRALDGTVWHVPNGAVLKVGNMSQHWSRAVIDVEVAYATDLAKAREVLKGVADEVWREHSGDVLEEPEVWGVEALGASGVAIRLVVKTKPSEQWRLMRILRERVKHRFDEAGIEIPFPQQTVWMRAGDGAGPPSEEGAPVQGPLDALASQRRSAE